MTYMMFGDLLIILLIMVISLFSIIALVVVLFITIYLIIYFIGKEYDPKSLKEKVNYQIIDPDSVISNYKISNVTKYLIQRGYNKQYVNVGGFPSHVFFKKECINEFRKDPFFNNVPGSKYTMFTMNAYMNVFYFITDYNRVNKNDIINFSSHCCAYSIKNQKGLPRGFQSGIISISVITSKNIDKEAIGWVEQQPPKHFATEEMPVIFDLINNIPYHYDNSQFWGSKIYPWSIDLINKSLDAKNPSYKITNSVIDSLKNII